MTLTAPMTVFSQRLPSRGTSAAMPPAATTLPELASEPAVRNARLDSTSCCRRAEALGAVSASSRQHVPSTSLRRRMPAQQRATGCTCGTRWGKKVACVVPCRKVWGVNHCFQ